MKKLKFLSVLLAMLTAFTSLSALSTSAAVTKTVSSIEIVEVPDDIYSKSAEEMLYGITVEVGYTNNTSETYTVSQDNIEDVYVDDNLDSLAYSYATASITIGRYSYVSFSVCNYLSDFVYIDAFTFGDDIYEDELIIDYPEDYELPEIFCNDYLVYRTNSDDTLTLINHTSFPYFFFEDYDGSTVVIPEEIDGKTVTSVADYALLGSTHPSSVTIPGTVTSIGKYAFGYCFYPDYLGDNHYIPDNVSQSRLAYSLPGADYDETFLTNIIFYSDDAQALSDKLQAEYLYDCKDYEYNEDIEEAYATLTKAQIYSMQDVEDITIILLYEMDSYIAEEIYDFAEYAGYDAEMCVEISVYAESDEDFTSACEELSETYFGGRTDYALDYEYYSMIIDANFDEIKAASEDEWVDYIYFYGADKIYYDLYKELYFEEPDYKTDVFAVDYSEESMTDNFTQYAETYFAGCDYEIFNCEGRKVLIVNGASKQQIFDASQDEDFYIDLFNFPLVCSYDDIVIYGENGSAAQSYAEENSIAFVGTGSQYQLGDVNLDGVINVTDATEILKYNVELVTFTDEQKELADFDQNGIINVTDVSELQRSIAS